MKRIENNASFARNVERWCQIAPGRVRVWEYGACFTNLLGPYPCLNSMADNLRWYHERGLMGVEIQGNYVSAGGDLAVLKNYVWGKLMWDPLRDTHALMDEFCKGYYGPAAGPIERYVDLLERSVVEPKMLHADEFNAFPYLTPDIRAQAEALRREALAAAANQEPWLRRVREATASIAAVDLWKPGPLVERDGRLVRSDIAGDSLAQAGELLKDIRGGTPSEYSQPESAHARLLALQGGPLVTLSRGDLRVKIAPLLNGQIRELSFRDRPLLQVESNPRARGFPQLGGSIESFPLRIAEIDGEPTPTAVHLKSAAGTSPTLAKGKPWITKTLELMPDGVLRSSASLSRTPAKNDKGAAVRTTTVYALGTKQQPHVEAIGADGKWRPVAIAADGTACDLADFRSLRIGLPNQACRVEDRYLEPAAAGGKITYDPKLGTLTIVVEMTPIAGTLSGDHPCFNRELSVTAD